MTNLTSRRELAAKTFNVGKNKIFFENSRISEVKEAITKQDMRDLLADGAIRIRENSGRKQKPERRTRKGPGKIKMTIGTRKTDYMILTRKFRRYVKELRNQGKLDKEKYYDLRKKIKSKMFKDKAHLKEHTGGAVK